MALWWRRGTGPPAAPRPFPLPPLVERPQVQYDSVITFSPVGFIKNYLLLCAQHHHGEPPRSRFSVLRGANLNGFNSGTVVKIVCGSIFNKPGSKKEGREEEQWSCHDFICSLCPANKKKKRENVHCFRKKRHIIHFSELLSKMQAWISSGTILHLRLLHLRPLPRQFFGIAYYVLMG